MIEQQSLLEFLVTNMEEMEIELRAHSIVLDALQHNLIGPEEIPGSLKVARRSRAMLEFVENKYVHLPHQPRESSDTNIEALMRMSKASGVTH